MNTAAVQCAFIFALLILGPHAMCHPQEQPRKLKAVLTVKHGARSAIAPAFSADSRIIATASVDSSEVKFWSVPDGAFKGSIVRPGDGGITSLQLSNSSKLIAVASLNRSINVMRVADGTVASSLDTKPFLPSKVAFSSDDQFVYCIEEFRFDSRIRSFNLDTLRDNVTTSTMPSIATISVASNVPFLVSENAKNVSIVELSGRNRSVGFVAKDPVRVTGSCSRFSVNETYLACAAPGESRVGVYRRSDGKEAGTVNLPDSRQVIDIMVTGKPGCIVVVASATEGADKCFVATYDALKGNVTAESEVNGPILELTISRDSELIAAGMYNGDVNIWAIPPTP